MLLAASVTAKSVLIYPDEPGKTITVDEVWADEEISEETYARFVRNDTLFFKTRRTRTKYARQPRDKGHEKNHHRARKFLEVLDLT